MSALLTADITMGDGPYSIMLTHHHPVRHAWRPIAGSHAGLVVLNRNRATTLWDARRFRRAVSRASRHANCGDYRAIPLMPRVERRAFHRAKDMN